MERKFSYQGLFLREDNVYKGLLIKCPQNFCVISSIKVADPAHFK